MKAFKTYSGRINREDCDLYGHMNTLKYIEKFYAAADVFLPKIGLCEPGLFRQGLGVAYLEFNHKYLKECFEGEEIEIFGEIVEKTSKVMSLKQVMRYKDKEVVLSESLLKFLVFDLESRKSMKWEDKRLRGILKGEVITKNED